MKNSFRIVLKLVAILLLDFFFFIPDALSKTDLSLTTTDITFSQKEAIEGEKVRIFARVFNVGDADVYGFVVFFNDGNEISDPQPISVKINTYDDVFIDWSAELGNHNIQAKIVGTTPQDENSDDDLAIKDNYFVDADTDKDGVGNGKDLDDDNDGLSDIEEMQKGTNPLKKDIIATPSQREENVQTGGDGQEEKKSQSGVFSTVTSKAIAVAKSVIQNINEFADRQKENLEKKKEEVKKGLEGKAKLEKENENISSKEKGKIEKSLKYAMLASLSVVSFVLDHKILFYLALAFIFYQVFKFLFRRIAKAKKS